MSDAQMLGRSEPLDCGVVSQKARTENLGF